MNLGEKSIKNYEHIRVSRNLWDIRKFTER